MTSPAPKNGATNAAGDLDRRSFLQILAAAFSMAALPSALTSCDADGETVSVDEESLTPSAQIEVVRPEDLLVLTIGLVNLEVDTTGSLAKVDAKAPAHLVVDYPPQIVVEETRDPAPPGQGVGVPTAFARSRIGGRSRLVFRLPDAFAGVPFTLDAILALCSASDMIVPSTVATLDPTATLGPPSPPASDPLTEAITCSALSHVDAAAAKRLMSLRASPTPSAPPPSGAPSSSAFVDRTVSYVEMPFRLLLAPNPHAAWAHATKPIRSAVSGRSELWHSVLGVRGAQPGEVDERNAALRTARAVWTRDDDAPTPDAAPSHESLSADDRRSLVALSLSTAPAFPAVQVDRMMLSALGGHLDARADYDGITHAGVLAWAHHIAGGREHFAAVETGCVVLPFGQPATVTKYTVRNESRANGPIGQLYQWQVVRVRNPVVVFPDGGETQFPFTAVVLQQTCFVCLSPQSADGDFWPNDLAGNPIFVDATAFDRRGRPIELRVPLFVTGGGADTRDAQDRIRAWTAKVAWQPDFHGQRIAYAPSKTDHTTFSTGAATMTLRASTTDPKRIQPTLASMQLTIDALHSLYDGAPRTFTFHPLFQAHGLDPQQNPAQILFSCGDWMKVDFTGRPDGGAGFVAPNVRFTSISATTGPINDATVRPPSSPAGAAPSLPLSNGDFAPDQFFQFGNDFLDPKILGVFPLRDIIKTVTGADAQDELQPLLGALMNGPASALVPKAASAMRYAPRFLAKAVNDLERLVGSFEALRGQLETLFVHATELLGARDVIGDAASQLADRVQAVRACITDLYATLLLAADDVMKRDVNTLTGQSPPIPGFPQGALPNGQSRISVLSQKIDALRAALVALSTNPPTGTVTIGPADRAAQLAGVPLKIVDGVLAAVGKKLDDVKSAISDASAIVAGFTAAERALASARDLTLDIEWQPKITPWSAGSVAAFVPESEHALTLAMTGSAKAIGGKPADLEVSVRLDAFHFYLGGLPSSGAVPVTLSFDHLAFRRVAGKTPDVDVVFRGLVFGGKLAFLETLRHLIPLDGFSDPPHLDIEPTGITASYSLLVPSVAVGMFSLENIKISAELRVPFVSTGGGDTMRFTFAFCDRDHPFLITVAMLGGGGYFLMSVTPAGIEHVEASISVAAQIAFDLLGVAYGCLSISAGIVFAYDQTHGVTITAYLRLHGELDVLGLITVSVDLKIDMEYEDQSNKLVAHASIHVDVKLLFFHTSVDIPFERKFSGNNGDPTMADLMPLAQLPAPSDPSVLEWASPAWQDYVMAYACAAPAAT